MKVMIIAEYLDDISNPSTYNSRFLSVADELAADGHEVQIVTTDFIHSLKKHVSGISKINNYPTVTLHEPGYKKNISLKRFYSHYVLSKNLKKWLKSQPKPDVIYSAIPSLDFAYEAAAYAKKQKIKFVVDVQDLWPEAFEMVINIPVISHLIFLPLKWRADSVYRKADSIISVSDTYMKRVLSVNKTAKVNRVVFLGTDLNYFDKCSEKTFAFEKNDDEFLLGYAGTLGHSYDLITVFDALEKLSKLKMQKQPKLLVMGDGPMREKFEQYSAERKLPVVFTGKLPYSDMAAGLKLCDAAINPIKRNSAGSIINKHGDYAAAGIPVINTQESEEYRNLVDSYEMGINCECENSEDVANAIIRLANDDALRNSMGKNARNCAETCFNRKNTYKKIIYAIEN